MKLSEFKNQLAKMNALTFILPSGENIPAHFHITEVGLITRHFLDCGGGVHQKQVVNFQLWIAADYDHRLKPSALADIIKQSEKIIGDSDPEVEVEHQLETIGRFALEANDKGFVMKTLQTDCLAEIRCDIPRIKPRIRLSDLGNQNCCTPGTNCC